ncbi:hypothetical protein VSR01_02360 [Actinacidiphila sp. DG2A-62]|uniref:hypothetical protein n=1 Tax=Actinacidiphila sp. DG2A-62 TaxID=3108821 RepID=UPI002DB6D2F6|nr:hypothetical protein [Actinacidiphila sp. DG2A-62]MEC3992448.1 hypothetical protein [Actinacidiphila sp. DG2A-62]
MSVQECAESCAPAEPPDRTTAPPAPTAPAAWAVAPPASAAAPASAATARPTTARLARRHRGAVRLIVPASSRPAHYGGWSPRRSPHERINNIERI